ncbi:type II secretion system protein GspL [Phenylobacterium sp.]|jgi:general secretion pathway protein L|uniref:type II secretion system protein GspL n=1 Tax=Phenylobacterium sp. TaxID=1871053 RepID=UPI0037838568
MKRTRLVFAPGRPQDPPTYLLLDEAGNAVGRGEQPVQSDPALTPTRVLLVVPGVEVAARWLHLPTRSEAQARAAAALMLEDDAAFADEPLHLAVGPLEADGHRLVAAVAESRLRSWLDLARTYGLDPDAVVADHLLLPQPLDERPVAIQLGETLAVRGERLAFAAEPDMVELLAGGEVEVLDGETAVRQLAEGAEGLPLDLRQGPFAPADGATPPPRQMIRAAILAGLLLLSPAILDGVQAVRLNLAAGRLEAETTARAAAILPKGTALNEPAVQVEAAVARAELASGGGPAGLAARLFTALSGIDGAQIDSLIVSEDGALRATLSHGNYSDVELLRDALARSGITSREEASREEGGRIVSDVILGVRP